MRQVFGALSALLCTAGCGLTVDAGRFREVGETSDGGVDAGGDAGAGVAQLSPAQLEEGAGGSPSVGRGVALLVGGGPFSDAARVESADERVELSAPILSSDRGRLAVRVWVLPFEDLAADAQTEVSLTLRDGDREDPLTLTILGLDELELRGTLTATDAAGRYSRIRTFGAVTVTGAEGLTLESAGAILVEHPILAAASAASPGPGGLGPGEGDRTGASGASVDNGCAGGGGGAGGRTRGGDGDDGATGGPAAQRPDGLPVSASGGHGGGSGGADGQTPGERGGAGGGWLHLEGATLEIQAAIDVSGSAGVDASDGNCGGSGNSGAGGGGSGGWVTARAHGGLSAAASVDVSGGAGGSGGPKSGGAGSDGWLRIDAPASGDLTAMGRTGGVAPGRGPSWTFDDPRVSMNDALGFEGPPDAEVEVWVDGARGQTLTLDSMGRGAFDAPSAGPHTVCLTLGQEEEHSACAQIVVLP